MTKSSDDRAPSERVASSIGRSPAEVAGLDRLFAGLREVAVNKALLGLQMSETAGAFRNFADAWAAVDERLFVEEAAAVAGHPDLVELNVYLDGFYSPPAG